DFDLSPGTGVGGNPSLVYNRNTIQARPVIEATLASDPAGPVPSQIQVQLTWNNGAPQSWVTFGTSGHPAGDTYLLAFQVSNTVAATGLYPWQLDIRAFLPSGGFNERVVSGTAQVVVRDSNDPFGTGWFLSGLDQLLPVSGGVLWVYGSGGS